MAMRFYQGKYKIQHPEKYVGDYTNIIYRSSWEWHLMRFCDLSKNVIRWSSEEIVIPYYDPMDDKEHRYFVDFYMEYRNKNGQISKELIEVKPADQISPPKVPKKKTQKSISNYNEACKTFVKNKMKWAYATKWAEERGMTFRVMNENDLGISRG